MIVFYEEIKQYKLLSSKKWHQKPNIIILKDIQSQNMEKTNMWNEENANYLQKDDNHCHNNMRCCNLMNSKAVSPRKDSVLE